jgi:hypothetical protein
VVLLCATVYSSDTVDLWIGPDPSLSRTSYVLLLPNQMYPGLHAGDPKDHDGYVPPRPPNIGDRL